MQFKNGLNYTAAFAISTPFEGFNDLGMSGSLLTEPDHYEATLAYNSDGYNIQLKGKFSDGYPSKNIDSNNNVFKNTTNGSSNEYYNYEDDNAYDYENERNARDAFEELTPKITIFILEGHFNDQKMFIEDSLVTATGPMGYRFNASTVIETPFDFLRRAKLYTAYEEEYKNGRIRQHAEGSAEYDEFEVRYPNAFAHICRSQRRTSKRSKRFFTCSQ